MKSKISNERHILDELEKEFFENKVFANFFRLRMLAIALLFLDLLFIVSDYSNYQKGLWTTLSYKYLFYTHLIFGLGMIVINALYLSSNLRSVKDVKPVHNAYEIIFGFFCLFTCAVISGWIDQRLHGQLTVYIIGCLVLAVFFNMSPKVSFWVYFLSYIVVTLGIEQNQSDALVQHGHYINTLMLIIVSWLLSLTLNNSRVQDFLHKNYLEHLVKGRTKELQDTNQQLLKEMYERKQIERKIFRLASIVESTDDGIIGMTIEGIITDWNRGAECIYGYTLEEMAGQSVRKLFPPDRKFELDDILLTVSQGKSVSHYETTRQRKDGRIIDVFLTVSPIKNNNETIIGASTIVRDVTSQKKIEKEMARMDQMNLVGEMAASIGHEVRNPMTTVRGFLQLLGENTNILKYTEYIPLMISELDRANHIITEFLSISRTKVTEASRHNLNDIINSILPLIQVDAIRSDKWVTTKLSVIPDLILDNKEMRQMILNFARNGFEAMSNGGCLTIETQFRDSTVILSIQDEGTGIKPEIIDRLGTPFLTTKETGTGLGLAVCYGIAARHNAFITIESSPLGSTFSVKFKAPILDN